MSLSSDVSCALWSSVIRYTSTPTAEGGSHKTQRLCFTLDTSFECLTRDANHPTDGKLNLQLPQRLANIIDFTITHHHFLYSPPTAAADLSSWSRG